MKKLFLICCFFSISIYCAELDLLSEFESLDQTDIANDTPVYKISSNDQNIREELTTLINQAKKEFVDELQKLKRETENKQDGREIFKEGFEKLKKEFEEKIEKVNEFVKSILAERHSIMDSRLTEYSERLKKLELEESSNSSKYIDRSELSDITNRLKKLEDKPNRSSCFGFLNRRKDDYKKMV